MKKYQAKDVFFYIFNTAGLVLLAVIMLYPFLNVLAISLNDSLDTVRGGLTIFPRQFTLNNYSEIFGYPQLLNAFIISILRTVIGTGVGIFSTAMVAYVLSRQDFFLKKIVSVLFVITMYVSGGMIPDYMLIRNVGLINRFEVYILPNLIMVFNVFVLRSYISELPFDLQESAKLDGANDFVIFWKIVMPLCLPVLATLCLFIAVMQWNSWFDTYLYAGSNKMLTTLQYELQKILSQSQASSQDIYRNVSQDRPLRISPESIRMAMTIIATVPILVVYPFLQKYFVKGLTIGAIKG
jgi:putative aldouronate transport system permease protein